MKLRATDPKLYLRNVVKTILARPDWRSAMRTTFTLGDKRGDEVPETPLRLLIRFFPDLAEQARSRPMASLLSFPEFTF